MAAAGPGLRTVNVSAQVPPGGTFTADNTAVTCGVTSVASSYVNVRVSDVV